MCWKSFWLRCRNSVEASSNASGRMSPYTVLHLTTVLCSLKVNTTFMSVDAALTPSTCRQEMADSRSI